MAGASGSGGRCTESRSWGGRPEPLVLLIWEEGRYEERYAEGEDMQSIKARRWYALGRKGKMRYMSYRKSKVRMYGDNKMSRSPQTQSHVR